MKRFLPLAAVALAISCAHPEAPLDPSVPPDPELASPRDINGVGNFCEVTDSLWRGAQPTAEGLATLKSMGVKTVVNLRMLHSDRDALKGLGLRYCEMDMTALHPDDEDVAAFLKIATDPALRPVFVHCQHGADRTGVCVAAYRVVVQGWPMSKARRELPVFGFHEIFVNLEAYLDQFDAARVRSLMDKAHPKIESIP